VICCCRSRGFRRDVRGCHRTWPHLKYSHSYESN
jgi:hypothetical protein